MKKIIHFVSNNWTSGLEKIVMNICSMVPGYKFIVVVPKGPIEKDLKTMGINYIALDKMNAFSVNKVIKNESPDVVHGHDVKASLYLTCSFFYCRKNNIKIVSELHNDDERMKKVTLRSMLYFLGSFAYDNVVLVSNIVLENYIFKKSISKKSIVIDNVINPQIRNDVPFKTEKSDFLFLGRLERQKNPELFINFIRRVKKTKPDVSAFVIGKGSLKNEIIGLIQKYKLQNNIKLLGYMSNPYPYLSNTKAVVITSRYEGFCIVALEAMIFGKPVISTDINPINKFVDNTCGITSDSLADLVSYGNKLLQENDFLNYSSRNAFEKSKQINNVEKFIKSYQRLYSYS